MDRDRFDTLNRLLSGVRSRRGLASLFGIFAAGGGLPALLAPLAEAKEHPGKPRHGADGRHRANHRDKNKREKVNKSERRRRGLPSLG